MVTGHFEHGMALRDLKRHEDAIKQFELSLLEFPSHTETVVMIAWCNYSLGRYREGFKIAKTAAAMDPNNERPHTLMGACEIALDQFKKAQGHLRSAVALNPANAYSYYLLGFALGKKRRWKEALIEINRSIELSPENADYLSHKSHILLMLGKKEEAKQTSLSALRLTPEDSRTHSQHGQILLAEGKVEEAIKHYREAVRNNPRDIWLMAELVEAARGRMWLFRQFLGCRLWLQRQPIWISLAIIFFPVIMVPLGIIAYNNHLVNDRFMEVIVTVFLAYIGLLLFVPVIMDGLTSLDHELKLVFPPKKRRKSIAVLFIFSASVLCVLVGLVLRIPVLFGFSIVGLVCLIFMCIDEKAFPSL
jgi:tetratricopeptide (TPR) repeat protein